MIMMCPFLWLFDSMIEFDGLFPNRHDGANEGGVWKADRRECGDEKMHQLDAG